MMGGSYVQMLLYLFCVVFISLFAYSYNVLRSQISLGHLVIKKTIEQHVRAVYYIKYCGCPGASSLSTFHYQLLTLLRLLRTGLECT